MNIFAPKIFVQEVECRIEKFHEKSGLVSLLCFCVQLFINNLFKHCLERKTGSAYN